MEKEVEKNRIISIGEIREILENYRIGKKPLAKLLGWGETTIIRYIDGDIPTGEYSDKLKAILENPSYYYEILLKNKDNLTNVAFRKSKKAVLSKIMETKMNLISQIIVNLYDGQISARDMQTLVYYCQGFHLGFYDEALFTEDYMVQDDNIPYPKLFKEMSGHTLYTLELDENVLSSKEQELIHAVVNAFHWYGTATYQCLYQNEKSSLRIARDKQNNKVVSKDTIRTLFQEIIEMYQIEKVDDIILYPINVLKERLSVYENNKIKNSVI